MEFKDICLIIIALLGWIWGITQFFINRSNQKKDKLLDRRYEAYSSYMKKVDELMNSIRTDPQMIYGISPDFMKIAVTGEEVEINKALIQFSQKLLDFVKKTSEPLLIMKQELNSLMLICSNKLEMHISELIKLVTDFNNEMQNSLGHISPNDSNEMIRKLITLSNNERYSKFEALNKKILKQMRIEIGINISK
jgi:hypothetical protein